MGHVDNNLMLGEIVLYRTKIHWIKYIVPSMIVLIGISLFSVADELAIFVFGVGALSFIKTWFLIFTSEFALTSERIITKVGLVRRDTLELLLENIEGVQINQSFFGRIFGYGTMIISGTGSAKTPFRSVAAPFQFWQQVQRQSSVIQRMRIT